MEPMSSDTSGPRPREVTIAGWTVAVASVMLVVSVFDAMARLHSVDTRDSLTRALGAGSAKDLGISLTDALGVMRAALFVAGVGAVVTGILGVFVLQRHTTARIVLTVAAVPVVLTAPFSGGVLGLLIGAATALLWSRPARDWFAGRAPARPAAQRVAPSAVQRPVRPPLVGRPPDSGGGPSPTPRGVPGWGGPARVDPSFAPLPYAAPRSAEVPVQVRVACVLTWVLSTLTALMYVVVLAALLADRARVLRLLHDNPALRDRSIGDHELTAVVVTASVVIVLWCLAACAMAVFAWRRHAWAWVLLMVSIGATVAVGLVSLPYSLLHLAAAVVALRLLLLRPTRAWFRGAGQPPAGPPAGWAPPNPADRHTGGAGQGSAAGERQEKPPVW